MNRRELLASLVGVPGVGRAKPVEGGTRAIILTVHPDAALYPDDVAAMKDDVRRVFAEAGIGDVPVVFLCGLAAEAVT